VVEGDGTKARNFFSRQVEVLSDKMSYFLPMCFLFFFMAFNNTIFDSTKDTLLITSVGGAEQIPFVTLYAVLPASCLFLFLYSVASKRYSRRTVFNWTIGLFITFFAAFAHILYPNRHVLHSEAVAAWMAKALPEGLQGLGQMIYQWSYTLFYVMSELWGDVILSLNFWVLANETTESKDAIILYPLFGLGANVAQFVSGQILTNVEAFCGQLTYDNQLKFLVNLTIGVAACIYGLNHWLDVKFVQPKRTAMEKARREREEEEAKNNNNLQLTEKKKKVSFWENAKTLGSSPALQCLAAIALAQGITTNLIEVAWKAGLREKFSDPRTYSAFMGSVSSALGLCTGAAMLISPTIFLRCTWRQAASVNPILMLYGGSLFFLTMIFSQGFMGFQLEAAVAQGMQGGIILAGTALYVFGRASKFSLLKPAEEMVYITLDENSRRSGKAAIDVVGSQVGKSLSSLLQQVFLIFGHGKITRTYPMMAALLFIVGNIWMKSVQKLADLRLVDSANHHGDEKNNKQQTSNADAAAPEEVTKASAMEG
jgi:AAA family ATP:ADP antiporter